MMPRSHLLLVLLTLLIAACSGGGSDSSGTSPPPAQPPPSNSHSYDTSEPLVDNSSQRSLEVLLVGNSHSAGIVTILETLLRQGQPLKTASVELAPGAGFLADRINDGRTAESLESNAWTHVILQAQKYSSTRTTTYPTTAAEYWIRGVKIQGATPIMFPEHPRRGNNWESQFLLELHQGIAAREPACVAPTGPVWDEVQSLAPEYTLHEPDGNHASEYGRFLNAAIFYQIITGDPATSIPSIPGINIPDGAQRLMKQSVAGMLAAHPPCAW